MYLTVHIYGNIVHTTNSRPTISIVYGDAVR